MRIRIFPLLAALICTLCLPSLVFSAGAAPAAPAAQPAPAPKAAQKPAAETVASEITISLDDLRTLLDRKETPRVVVANVYGGKVTGRAVAMDPKSGQLQVDVSAEGIGIDGILGVKTAAIVSIKVLMPLTQDQIDAAKAASEKYLSGIRSETVPLPPSEPLSVSGEVSPPMAVPAAAEAVSSTGSELAAVDQETQVPLLKKYPPKEGWGPKRVAEIVRKSVVLHLEPFGKEKTFLKDYDAWKGEYNKERAQQLEALEAFKGMGQPVPPDFEVWPELEGVPSLEGAPSPAPDSPVGNSRDEKPVGMPSAPSAASSGQ